MSTQPRTWTIDGDPFAVELEDESALMEGLMEAAVILKRIGGSMIIAGNRTEIAPDVWQTTEFIFKWSSYFPGQRAAPVAVEPEPEPVVADAA